MRNRLSIVIVAIALAMITSTVLTSRNVLAVPHVVDGDVGPSNAPGLGNPANLASATYYLTTKPAEPIQVESDIQDADGTNLAYYGTIEVGSGWNWAVGDEVVVVIETVNGVNGWTGANYTTSSDFILTVNSVDSLPTANVETYPTLMLVKTPTSINVTWTGLADANANILNYTVYRAASAAGPFTAVGASSAQSAAGSVWFNETRPLGQWCYQLSVNYRRDTIGGIYETTGRSGIQCAILSNEPYIQLTSPADGATGVRLNAPITITFSEAMNTGTVAYTTNPSLTYVEGWSSGDTVLTLTHATAFTAGTSYQVTVTAGQDLDGNNLVTGPVVNPWSFTTNNPPSVAIDPSNTLVGRCCDGGSGLPIPWTMSDVETSVGQLVVWLNYTIGATSGTIAGPLTGRTSPDSYTWTTPAADGSATITITVLDAISASAQDSANAAIDSTLPFVQSVTPSQGATNVAITAQAVITFSEPMQTSSVAVSFTPTVTGVTLAWDATNTTATVTHADFLTGTQYTMTVAATAKDDCTPGNEMGADNTTSFTTGTTVKEPNPPTNLAVSSKTYNSVVLTWTAPTQYTDSSALPTAEIASYKVYRAATSTGTKTLVGTVTTTTFTDSTVEQKKTYYYWVTTVATNTVESAFSGMLAVDVPERIITDGGGGVDWIWIVIILIVVILVIAIIFMMRRRKKPEEAASTPEAAPEEAPPEEVPPSEVPPEEIPPETGPEPGPEEAPGAQSK